jgi:hypothetical protein
MKQMTVTRATLIQSPLVIVEHFLPSYETLPF